MERLGIGDIIHACGAVPFNCKGIEYVTGINTDSRKLQKGDMFIALKGEKFDGHEFAEAAVKSGAAVILSQQKLSLDIPYLLVQDTLKALHSLAKYYRSLFDIPFIAVTGSSGKTTTKDMIASVLSQKYHVLKTEGNFNNAIGLPLTIFRLEKQHDICILEMGMSSLGEIETLAEIARPNVGVISNIGTAHIENLKTRENILKAKTEIFTYFSDSDTAIVNGDNDMLQKFDGKPYKIIHFGLGDKNECRALNLVEKAEAGIEFDVVYMGIKESYQVPMPGIHNVYNALSAICVAKKYGLSTVEINKGLEQFKPSKMRMEIFKGILNTKVVNDAYNANPDSMMAAINVLAAMEAPARKVCILGDMLELGDYSEEGHYKVGKFAAEKGIHAIVGVGNMAKFIIKGASMSGGNLELCCFDNNADIIENIRGIVRDKDTILIKGSRGMRMENIVESLREGR